jgi:hypothetical protein
MENKLNSFSAESRLGEGRKLIRFKLKIFLLRHKWWKGRLPAHSWNLIEQELRKQSSINQGVHLTYLTTTANVALKQRPMKYGVKSLNFKSKTPRGFIKSVPKMDDLLFNPSVFIDQKKRKTATLPLRGFRNAFSQKNSWRVPRSNRSRSSPEDTCWSYGKVEDAT